LRAGAIDVALATRAPSPEEQAAGFLGFEYGRSPFVLVTVKPMVTGLTTAAVADFLSGRIVNWPDGQQVRLVLRPKHDGDTALLAAISPDIAGALDLAHQRQGMVVASTDQDAADEAERVPGALSTNTLALLISENRKLRAIPLDGVAPTIEALADGSYRHFKSLFLVTRGAPSGATAGFVRFIRSTEGRQILMNTGHLVPQ